MRTWYETDEIEPGLFRTSEPFVGRMFQANAFTVLGRDFDMQVDFGNGVLPFRHALPLSGKPVIAVATHAHVDHIGGFHEFGTRLGHAAEAEGFATMAPEITFQAEFRDNAFGPTLMKLPTPDFRLAEWALTPAPLTGVVQDGDRIDLGDRVFTVLHVPGHSPGSIALFDEVDGLLLAGDAIYEGQLVDDIAGASIKDYLATMTRLAIFDCRIAYGGHGPGMERARMQSIASGYLTLNSCG